MNESLAAPAPAIRPVARLLRITLARPFHFDPGEATAASLQRIATTLARSGAWADTPDLLFDASRFETGDGASVEDWEGLWAEFTYFHPGVRDRLYGAASDAEPADTRVLERRDVRGLRLQGTSTGDARTTTARDFQVLRVRLHLFRFGVGVLWVELAAKDVPLDEVLATQDRVRRAFPPYWSRERGKPASRHYPLTANWIDAAGACLGPTSDYSDVEGYLKTLERERAVVVAPHWRWLLAPWSTDDPLPASLPKIEHLADDRAFLLTYAAFDDPRALTRADWVRLAGTDDPGPPHSLPYGTAFLHDFEALHFYDRFWDPHTRGPERMTTRYAVTDSSFLAAGSFEMRTAPGSQDPEPGFFADPVSGGLAHFRRHYGRMGFLLTVEIAAWFAIDRQISVAAAALASEGPPPEALRHARRVHDRALDIATRWSFAEVSNQIQAKELLEQWRRLLRMDARRATSLQHAQLLHGALAQAEEHRQSQTSSRLTTIATWFIPIGFALQLVLTYLSVKATSPEARQWWWPPNSAAEWMWVVTSLAIVLLTWVLALRFSRGSPPRAKDAP